ncbi:hypothetical protein BD779DRAFT_1675655 [Infundibulicybe gibba]|nr:hypothetical protein BD779DRAFT_1675655 [Infundibulicybe gibba]
MLPPELLLEVATMCDLATLSRLGLLNWQCHTIMLIVLRSRQHHILSFHLVEDAIPQFITLLHQSRAAVFGSCAWLMTDIQASWIPNDLNVITPRHSVPAWYSLLVTAGYDAMPSMVSMEMKGVVRSHHRFNLGDQKVVTVSESIDSQAETIAREAPCTSEANILTANRLTCPYPRLALEKRAIYCDDLPTLETAIKLDCRQITLGYDDAGDILQSQTPCKISW